MQLYNHSFESLLEINLFEKVFNSLLYPGILLFFTWRLMFYFPPKYESSCSRARLESLPISSAYALKNNLK